MKIIKLIQTCDAFPSQWDFHTDDNRIGYIRFRHVKLHIHLSEPGVTEIDYFGPTDTILNADLSCLNEWSGISEERIKHILIGIGFEIV
jgi:hypothetical protein